MKRYLVFAYWAYYPIGGWHDFQDSFDTLEEARKFAESLQHDHIDVIDTQTGEEVA